MSDKVRFSLHIDCETTAFKPEFYVEGEPDTYGDDWDQSIAIREQVSRILANLARQVYEQEPGTGTPVINVETVCVYDLKDTDGEPVGGYAWERTT